MTWGIRTTIDLINREVGYKNAMAMANPSKYPTARKKTFWEKAAVGIGILQTLPIVCTLAKQSP
jgi:hypothetical protein